MALKDDFVKGRALRSISAAWLNGVAKALNSLSIRFDINAKLPRIEKPPMPAGRSGWTIVLPPYPEAGEGGTTAQSAPQPWEVVKDGDTWKVTTPQWVLKGGEVVEKSTSELAVDASKPILRAKVEAYYSWHDGQLDSLNTSYTWELVDAYTAEEEDVPIYIQGVDDETQSSSGKYYFYTKIGEFTTETSGEGDEAVTSVTGFVQNHLGEISLGLPARIFTVVPGRVVIDFEGKRLWQQWNAVYYWPDTRGLDLRPVGYIGDASADEAATDYAMQLDLVDHVEDHVDGTLTVEGEEA